MLKQQQGHKKKPPINNLRSPALALSRKPKPEATAYNRALKLLARREHGRAELARKLQQKGFEADEVEQALQQLEARGYQDDQRYAETYTRGRVQLGYGELYIRNALESQGVDRHLVIIALQQLSAEEWAELAVSVYQRRFADSVNVDHVEREKRLRFMIARGFSFAQAKLAATAKSG